MNPRGDDAPTPQTTLSSHPVWMGSVPANSHFTHRRIPSRKSAVRLGLRGRCGYASSKSMAIWAITCAETRNFVTLRRFSICWIALGNFPCFFSPNDHSEEADDPQTQGLRRFAGVSVIDDQPSRIKIQCQTDGLDLAAVKIPENGQSPDRLFQHHE
jgi:hypothetical protein